MMVFLGILLTATLLWLILFLVTRGQTKPRQRVIATGLILGGAISVGAFVAMPWVSTDSADAFTDNVAWASHKLETVKPIFQALGQEAPTLSSTMDARALHAALCAESADQFCETIEKESALTGWRIWLLSRRVAPLLALDIGFLFLTALFAIMLGVALFLWEAIRWRGRILWVGLAALGIAIFSFVVVISFLDTLGTYTNLRLHLISALAELRITDAPWLFVGGMIVILVSLAFIPQAHNLEENDDVYIHLGGYYV